MFTQVSTTSSLHIIFAGDTCWIMTKFCFKRPNNLKGGSSTRRTWGSNTVVALFMWLQSAQRATLALQGSTTHHGSKKILILKSYGLAPLTLYRCLQEICVLLSLRFQHGHGLSQKELTCVQRFWSSSKPHWKDYGVGFFFSKSFSVMK